MDCFVIIPFSNQHLTIYDEIIKPTVLDSNLKPQIARDYTGSDIIIKEIVEGIIKAEIVIADVTGRNPNVNYELGVADSFNKKVIILTQSPEDIPFDYKHRRYYQYNPAKNGWQDKLKTWLTDSIKDYLNQDFGLNPWGFSISNKTFLKHSDNYEYILSDVLWRTHLNNRYDISLNATTTVDKNGHCFREELVEILFRSDVSHLLYEIYIDKPGIIRIDHLCEFDEKNSEYPMKWSVYSTSETNLMVFLIFNAIKKKGVTTKYYSKVYAENFLSNLIEFGKGRFPFGLPESVRIEKLIETYKFPNIPKFKSVNATIFNHPEKDKKNKVFYAKEAGEELVLEIDCSFSNIKNSKSCEILIDFKL